MLTGSQASQEPLALYKAEKVLTEHVRRALGLADMARYLADSIGGVEPKAVASEGYGDATGSLLRNFTADLDALSRALSQIEEELRRATLLVGTPDISPNTIAGNTFAVRSGVHA